ncbi:putative UV excision repair protein (RadW) [Aspergillus clavatus NRRL 1]|uniref:UV excision repair protein RAD23 n=1 Tax=Aspergillus clavatus (strain ATCC 1007 / CBS 513.65 / DSM 816 / NCTC 3887 / NRRL 1 / QM 1276 / 107) TaxID=344612 RepID=A1C9U3_ASPCL|nr:UV excision repair protein (RadW), putative [Aspergillus clavatus NRRL 1]EAW12511.1 UV excision repair protein (RadW), putative [Aspergillus clavatus NRRL 1]
MKLTFKDLKQQKFVIDAEPSETVGQVKEKISKEKGWEVSQLKLIYSGKILQDDKTIETYNIEEKGFIVCMVSKPKATSAAATPSQAPSTPSRAVASTPAAPPAPAPSAATSTPAVPATPSPAAPAQPSADTPVAFNDPSALLSGAQSEAVVAQMESMGFPRSDINRAMRAAFFNPDRAIEYLLNGIPETIHQEQQQQQQQQQAGAGAAASPPAPSAPSGESVPSSTGGDEPVNLFEAAAQAGTGEGAGRGARAGVEGAGEALPNLEFLRNNPHFQQLRQLVQQQPQMLEPILQQVAAGNPQIAQLIGQNEEQFLQLLSEEDDGALPPGTHAISVTEEERDAIERLCRLGFSRDLVIQAYFACDKNEELAANYLFENPDDPDDL